MDTPSRKSDPILQTTSSQLETFAENVEFLWKQSVPVLSNPPSPLQFLRDHVQCSRPCIIRNAILDDSGNPMKLTLDDIASRLNLKETMLTVDVTPDGHGDSVRTMENDSLIFVQPAECEMTIDEFRRRLRGQTTESPADAELDVCNRPILPAKACSVPSVSKAIPDNSVVYYSRQNDCLRKEIPDLYKAFPSGIGWAEEALGPQQPLDAVNLWVGNERAVSSMHKDHYENLFYVASGEKVFTVCPPADVAFLYEHRRYQSGRFQVNDQDGNWEVCSEKDNDDQVHWIAPDVTILNSQKRELLLEQYPLLKHVKPLEIRVREGEMLYLPSLWFHRVTQSCETVGVNYWYDMRFDSPLWCYFTFLQQLRHCDEADDE